MTAQVVRRSWLIIPAHRDDLVEQAHQLRVALVRLEVRAVARLDDRNRILVVGGLAHVGVEHLLLGFLEDCGEDLLLVREIRIERAR